MIHIMHNVTACSLLKAVLLMICASHFAVAATLDHIGSGLSWVAENDWQALNDLNDPDDGLAPALDFVGDASDPGAYYASDDNYFYFRMRLDVDTVISTTFRGAHLIMIDLANYTYGGTSGTNSNGSLPDFSFAWDSKSNDTTAHGLEMLHINTAANIWNGINFADLDGLNGSKGFDDINGAGRTGDGYIRSIDNVATQNLGLTTFLDFAVSWSYLAVHTPLTQQQFLDGEWSFALGSIDNATDHNNLNDDIAGGASVSSATTEGFAVVPEPSSVLIILFSLFGPFAVLRQRQRL